MPIINRPVVHKFGIISHGQRLNLQERLLKQSYLDSLNQPTIVHKIPTEVSDKFVQQYNAAKQVDEKVKLDELAHKMLERIKRKVGLKTNGRGSHVDLTYAWTDLSILAQCKGNIQEACFDVFVLSLQHSPILTDNIPALFYLAEMSVYWLRTDAVKLQYLRAAEIKLLKMGELVFLRLFYHHMAGHLQDSFDAKKQLFPYLNGLQECQGIYNPYPNALFSLRYMNEIGMIIIGDVMVQDELQATEHSYANYSRQEKFENKRPRQTSTPGASSHPGFDRLSRSVHDLSPTLWHALDIWRCTNQLSAGLSDALSGLAICGKNINKENWVDSVLALKILSEAARADINVLQSMQSFAQGIISDRDKHRTQSQHFSSYHHSGSDMISLTVEELKSYTLSDVLEAAESNSDDVESNHSRPTNPVSLQSRDGHMLESATARNLQKERSVHAKSKEGETTVKNTQQFPTQKEITETKKSARAASPVSSVDTYTNAVASDRPGIANWHWEVAVTYSNLMTDIVLNGSTSTIQKRAMIGSNFDLSPPKQLASKSTLTSAGLFDLVHFKLPLESSDGWSWRVRYTAVQGFVRISRFCAGKPALEGTRTAAWNMLSKIKSFEIDPRVLEALKVGEVDISAEPGQSTNIHDQIAEKLTAIYLPPLPQAVPPYKPRPKPTSGKATPRSQRQKNTVSNPLRTTLKDEILLTNALDKRLTAFKARADFALRRVVEDQWRKEVQQKLEMGQSKTVIGNVHVVDKDQKRVEETCPI